MPRYVAFLRGINLGNRRIKMDDLRAHFEALKFTHVSTFIASGNVIFDTAARDDLKLAAKIERHLEATLGYDVDTFVRTAAEVATAATRQPFPAAQMTAAGHTAFCFFLKAPLTPAQRDGLLRASTPTDEFAVDGREFYWLVKNIPSHESKVWASPAIRALKLPSATSRNLTMLRKLAALLAGD